MSAPVERCVDVPLSGDRAYRIHIASGSLSTAGATIAECTGARRAVIISQPTVARLWAGDLRQSLSHAGFGMVPIATFPSGERFKTVGTINRLYEKLYAVEPALDRNCVIVALGGGVVGDIAGFTAATYLRGLPYVQVPTTLLAMVDSSVGGKTGVDFRAGKNLIGAFHQPRVVIADPGTLATLPEREVRSGMAEVIKYGVISDPALLDEISERGEVLLSNPDALVRIIARCCEIKAAVVVEDEFERTGRRAALNFGHTIGHAIESATEYRRFKHGEAIAIGMMAAAAIGEEHGVTPPGVRAAIAHALDAVRLPTTIPQEIGAEMILPLLGRDKKSVDGAARFVLCERLGKVSLYADVGEAALRRGLERTYVREKP